MTTTSVKRTGVGGPETYWTPERVIAAIRRWVELYDEPPRSADWNPSSARWGAASWRIPRYLAGDPETGEPWPSLNAAKGAFDGKLTTAIRAAGFEPAKPGPRNRKDARPEVAEKQMSPEVRAVYDGAMADNRRLAKTVAARDRQLEAARAANRRLKGDVAAARRAADGRRRRTVTKTKTKTKTVVKADRKAVKEAVAAVRKDAKVEFNRLRLELASARRDSTRDASKLERAEATISELRSERRELKREVERASDRLSAAEARLARAGAPAPVEVREVVKTERIEVPGPAAREVEEARAFAAAAERKVQEADVRVARAERLYGELASAVTGEPRRLSPAEIAELRRSGPAGPAVLADALTRLAKARRREPGKTRDALREVAAAAVSWMESIR